MSTRELSRHEIMRRLQEKRCKQSEAATLLGLSLRQVKRLWQAYCRAGIKGLVSKRRGQPSHHQLPAPVKTQAVALLHQHYADFGPTLAHEKLVEVQALTISRESVRQLMIGEGLWHPHRARQPALHQLRVRRAALGELVQIDGSPHDWFEGRAARSYAARLY
jgi:hypothetical protein